MMGRLKGRTSETKQTVHHLPKTRIGGQDGTGSIQKFEASIIESQKEKEY